MVRAGYWATYYNHHVIKDITCVGRSFQQLIYGKLPDCIDRIKLSVVLGYHPVSVDFSNFFKFLSITGWWRSIFYTCKPQKRCWFYCLYKYLLPVRFITYFRGRTLITWTRITRIPRSLELNFLSLDQNFTEIYPDNSDSPLTRTVFRFPSEFELPGFYCSYPPRGVPLSWFFFFLGVPTSFNVSAEPQGCYAALSWKTPSYNSCPITRYTVHYRQSNQLIKWQTTFIERNLTKYRLKLNCSSTYKIMVLAWNDRGSSIKDAKVLAVTTEEGIRVVTVFHKPTRFVEILTTEDQPTFLTFSCTGSPLCTFVRV